MTDTIFALVTTYGTWAILASAFLSCLALPIPTSLMMLAGGAFAAAGDLALGEVVLAAFAGAVAGDQTGYLLGRLGGAPLVERAASGPRRREMIGRARTLLDRRGGAGVFLSTWAVAPLGPWVNFVAGAGGLGWARFTLADIAGEAIWVVLYVTLGMAFASQIGAIASLAGNVAGILSALSVAAMSIWWIRGAMKRREHAESAAGPMS